MACPVCVVEGGAIIGLSMLGVPEPIITMIIGMFAMSLATWTNHWYKHSDRFRNFRGQYLVFAVLYGVISIVTLYLSGVC